MKSSLLKYCSIAFLALLFCCRGLETMMPLLAGTIFEDNRLEMELPAEAEGNSEKGNFQFAETKEFLADHFPVVNPGLKYAYLSTEKYRGSTAAPLKVSLPVITPPPDDAYVNSGS